MTLALARSAASFARRQWFGLTAIGFAASQWADGVHAALVPDESKVDALDGVGARSAAAGTAGGAAKPTA